MGKQNAGKGSREVAMWDEEEKRNPYVLHCIDEQGRTLFLLKRGGVPGFRFSGKKGSTKNQERRKSKGTIRALRKKLMVRKR